MLQFSAEPKRLVSTFLTYRNDIDIYTEDEEKDKEFYKVLLTRLVDDKIKINDITTLGGKNEVIKSCKNEPDNGRKKIFIIDGDITIIHGKDIPNLKNLFVLDAYCIENFLLDKNSMVHFIYLNCAQKSKEYIMENLEFESWLNIYSNKFVDLFLHFAIIDFYAGKFRIFNSNKFHQIVDGVMTVREEAIDTEIEHQKSIILGLTTEENYISKLNELKENWQNNIDTLLTIVSGKDYLIPILLFKTQIFKKSRALPSYEEVKFSLAQFCDLERLSKLKHAIQSL